MNLDNRIKKINYVVRSWRNYFRITNMKSMLRKKDEHLRIRVIICKQWKKIRTRYKSLRERNVSHEIAFNDTNTKKGYY